MDLAEQKKNIEEEIYNFLQRYERSMRELSSRMAEAQISHYSSGCGGKRITYDIFPASVYVDEMLSMLTLDRSLKTKIINGFKDATAKGDYNPAIDFITYLRRWGGFAEQAMANEGASHRGIIAARVKLLTEELINALGEGKTGQAIRTTSFAKLMQLISEMLELMERTDRDNRKKAKSQDSNLNYSDALEAAKKLLSPFSLAS